MHAGVVRYVWPAWLVVLAWAGWELGVDGFTPTQQILTLAVGVIGLVLGATMVLERKPLWWMLGAAALGAGLTTVALDAGVNLAAELDTFYPAWWFIVIFVQLGITLAAGAAVGGVWRLVARRSHRP
jgi:hypothetical protein